MSRETHPSICRFCHANCGILVEVEGGRPVRVTGDPENPAYFGFTCAKGRRLPDAHAHPDRLLHSQKRRADGDFEPIASERAMDEIAARLGEIVAKHGPRAVALYPGTYSGPHPASIPAGVGFMLGLGSRMVFTSAAIDQPGKAVAAFERTMQQAAICLANEMVGGAERLRQDALDYTKMRMQFGRSIASFQVTKHKAADMLVDVEMAKSAAYYAAAARDEGDDELPALAALAKASASEAYLQTAIHAVQMHGGIGFTWDNDTHLWFKRAKSSEILFGDANWHREQMMRAMGV